MIAATGMRALMASSSSRWVAERRAGGVLHRRGTPRGRHPARLARGVIPCPRLVVADHRRWERGGSWGPEELPENQGAADEQCGDVDRDYDPVNAQRVVEHAVAHGLDDRVDRV